MVRPADGYLADASTIRDAGEGREGAIRLVWKPTAFGASAFRSWSRQSARGQGRPVGSSADSAPVIKQDRQVPGPGLRVPHRKSYVIRREPLLTIVERSELGIDSGVDLPELLLLLAQSPNRKCWRPSRERGRCLSIGVCCSMPASTWLWTSGWPTAGCRRPTCGARRSDRAGGVRRDSPGAARRGSVVAAG